MLTSRSLLATTTATVLGLALAAPVAAQQPVDVTTSRISGATRFDTAAAIADAQYDTTDHAVIARADDFPDAMTAAPLARANAAPILLTDTDSLPTETRDALEDLGVTTVTVLGGETAVSADVVTTLEDDLGLDVTRVEGGTRYATAAAVTRAVVAASDGGANFPGDQRAAFLAYGENFPDALATGPLAASRESGIPVLLTRTETLPQETRDAIEDLDIELVVIAGGPLAVSPAVEQELRDLGISVERVAGDTRQETATALADFGREFLDLDLEQVELTRGDLFVDALAAGPYAGAELNPVVLTQSPDELSSDTASWLAEQCGDITTIEAVGGEQAVTPETLDEAELAAETCSTEDGAQDLDITPMQPIEVAPGESRDFTLTQVDEQDPSPGFTSDIALFPCDAVDKQEDATWTFDDADTDGRADGIATTTTGAATITALNGEDVEDAKFARDVALGDDGHITATVTAGGEDCTDIVFFVDSDDDGALDVDVDGRAMEPWGFSEISWVSPNA